MEANSGVRGRVIRERQKALEGVVVGKRERSCIETKVHPIFSMATFQPLTPRRSFLISYRGHATHDASYTSYLTGLTAF